ncbi:MAG: hypothetical protein CUN55_10515 [Phototrophicales bacterium]|nr:MAG: hypothetical protein CUN55_10515 [Phototrophicales bacterium]
MMNPRYAIWWLATAHFMNDFFSGTLGIILAAQNDQIGLSNTQIGTASAIFLTVSIIQPFLGWVSDKYQVPHFMILGSSITALGLLVVGLAQSYTLILIGVLLGGFGNAMFHPTGLASARALGGPMRKGRSVALFMLGGNGGFAIGPFLSGFALASFGPKGIAPFVLLNLIIVPILFWRLQTNLRDTLNNISSQSKAKHNQHTSSNTRSKWYQTTTMMIAVYLIVVLLRGVIYQALSTFLPKYYTDYGNNLDFAGAATFALLFCSALGGFIATSLSDRLPRLPIVSVSLFLIAPLGWLLLAANGWWIFALSVPFGLTIGAQWPILLMIGQEVLPGGASGSSGLAFGWGFIANAGGTFVAGLLADWIGLRETLQVVSLLPMLGAFLVFLLPAESPNENPTITLKTSYEPQESTS